MDVLGEGREGVGVVGDTKSVSDAPERCFVYVGGAVEVDVEIEIGDRGPGD